MLTADGCRARRKRLWESVEPKPGCMVLGSPRSLSLFGAYYPSPFSYASQNWRALLLFCEDGASRLIVDNLQAPFARRAHVDALTVVEWNDGRHTPDARSAALVERVSEIVVELRPAVLAVDSGVPPAFLRCVGGRRSREVVDLDRAILAMSRAKDPDEVEAIRHSLAAIEAGYAAAREGVRSGMTELDAYAIVSRAAAARAAEPVIVYGDFASGPRTDTGGGGPTERVIQPGDLFIADFSVVVKGYRGDCCSTWVVDGKPTKRQEELASACLEAMDAGEGMLRPGTACRDVDRAVRSVFERRNLGPYFKHHSGHGIGLGHPDPPFIVPESSESLVPGDVITLEPGCYIPGLGGMRFEHNYLITDSGYERLSNHRLSLG